MTQRAGTVAAAVITLSVVAFGCATRSGTGRERPLHLELYPLEEGRTWTFRVTRPGEEETTTTITRVVAVEGSTVRLRSGTVEYSYELRDDGIWRPTQEAYLLRASGTAGTRWAGPLGGSLEVVATDETVEVPAGRFERCYRIIEDVPAAQVRQEHTFCPDVGPVRLVQTAEGVLLGTAELVAWGPSEP